MVPYCAFDETTDKVVVPTRECVSRQVVGFQGYRVANTIGTAAKNVSVGCVVGFSQNSHRGVGCYVDSEYPEVVVLVTIVGVGGSLSSDRRPDIVAQLYQIFAFYSGGVRVVGYQNGVSGGFGVETEKTLSDAGKRYPETVRIYNVRCVETYYLFSLLWLVIGLGVNHVAEHIGGQIGVARCQGSGVGWVFENLKYEYAVAVLRVS